MADPIKKITLLLFILCSAFQMAGQMDTIVQKNGLRSPVKIVEVTADKVRFRVPGGDTTKIAEVDKNSVEVVILSNGMKIKMSEPVIKKEITDTVALPLVPETEIPPPTITDFAQQYMGIEMSSMIFSSVSFNYRYIMENGAVSFRIPITYNLDPKISGEEFFEFNAASRKYSLGLEIDFFPYLQRRLSYYVGPEFKLGMFDYRIYNCFVYPCPGTGEVRQDGSHMSFVINNGMLFRVTPNMWADFSVGFGIQKNDRHTFGESITPKGALQFSIGYSF